MSSSSGTCLPNISQPVLTRQDSRAGIDSRFCCNICLDAVVDPVATSCGHLYCWPCLFRWLEPGMTQVERASLGLIQQPLVIDSNRRVCPVCKASCSVPNLVPIYVRESNEADVVTTLFQEESAATGTEGTMSNSKSDQVDDRNQSERESENETVSNETTILQVSEENMTGLRQRIRPRSQTIENTIESVPSRPAAQSPRHLSPSSPSSNSPTSQRYGTNSWSAPLTPTGHRGSLTHVLLLSIQQATAGHSTVPPLHRRHERHPADLDAEAAATEYLSRLLLMLGCFVILCLLLL